MEPVEIGYLQHILQDPRIEKVWFGDESLAQVYPEKGFYAPYPLSTDIKLYTGPKRDAIALFNPGGLKKNNLNQILAVALFLKSHPGWVLETNVANYEPVMKSLGIKYRLHPWLPTKDYLHLVGSCKINMAVSWAETNNYQVAEAGLLGVPSIISSTVPFPGYSAKPNDPLHIVKAIEHAASEARDIPSMVRRNLLEKNTQLQTILAAHR